MPFVIAVSALICPPLAILLCGKRVQAALSLAVYVVTTLIAHLSANPQDGATALDMLYVSGVLGVGNFVWAFWIAGRYDADRRAQRI